ncbi:MAG: sulfur carrier protein ThiS [Muribaculaceae bacterium]|nr:sulfur carrier protein ThiS [Muribaculaceae bacterium]
MKIIVNGKELDITSSETVANLIDRLGEGTGGIAVAVNDKLVRRNSWSSFQLSENDSVVIIKAAYGG